MEFKKFTSLENTYQQKLIDKVIYEGKSDQLWVVTEKIDGANFAFYYDGKELKVASRNQFVDGEFFGCQEVIDGYQEHIKALYKILGAKTLVIRGELFGQGIQKRVEYGPKDFVVFEIIVDEQILPITSTKLGVPTSKQVLENKVTLTECGSKYLKLVPIILITTSFKEALDTQETFKSLLTPESYIGDNVAEGLAIQPCIPTYFNNGSRIWFKKKSDRFSEVNKGKTTKIEVELSDSDKQIYTEVCTYITESRVASVISKLGKPTQKDFGRILGEVIQDSLNEFNKENNIDVKSSVENWKQFAKELQRETSSTVRKEFVKHF